MKKYLAFITALMLCLTVLCACGAKEPAASATKAPETEGTTQAATDAPETQEAATEEQETEEALETEEATAGDENCEHDWLPADCYNPQTCLICGATEGNAEHQYELVNTKAATCIEEGVEEYYCKVCDDPHTEKLPLAEHTVVDGVCTYCNQEIAQ